jgi:hypothetical protein
MKMSTPIVRRRRYQYVVGCLGRYATRQHAHVAGRNHMLGAAIRCPFFCPRRAVRVQL